jgi:hypothetical protein
MPVGSMAAIAWWLKIIENNAIFNIECNFINPLLWTETYDMGIV